MAVLTSAPPCPSPPPCCPRTWVEGLILLITFAFRFSHSLLDSSRFDVRLCSLLSSSASSSSSSSKATSLTIEGLPPTLNLVDAVAAAAAVVAEGVWNLAKEGSVRTEI